MSERQLGVRSLLGRALKPVSDVEEHAEARTTLVGVPGEDEFGSGRLSLDRFG